MRAGGREGGVEGGRELKREGRREFKREGRRELQREGGKAGCGDMHGRQGQNEGGRYR